MRSHPVACGRGPGPGVAARPAASPTMVVTALVVMAMAWVLPQASLGQALDIIPPLCAFVDPPAAADWKLWSDPTTWGSSGSIPGVGSAAGAAAEVPCGTAILLDVPSVTLSILNITGHLKIADDPRIGNITIVTNYVLVQGHLTIGTPSQPYTSFLDILLTAAPNRTVLTVNRPPVGTTGEDGIRDLGHKAFAVVGGQLELYGMPGGSATPAWVRLARNAAVGDRQITVDGVVGAWPVGGTVVVASTDYNPKQAEARKITSVGKGPSSWVLGLDRPLNYSHVGEPVASGLDNVTLAQSAEVALLTRNIRIRGQQETGHYALEGGHLIVFQTQTPQYVEGVELVNMGQQGHLGRYPLHFHLLQDVQGQVVGRKNSIHDSNQRCVVVHGTFNMLVEENVAYNTSGHCYIVEEGIETGNTFTRNLGILTNPVSILIPMQPNETKNETDNTPSTFWITNPNNTFTFNVAGGSTDSGFWFELRSSVRGASRGLRGAADVVPSSVPLGAFEGNVAHSNTFGVRTYPFGYKPLVHDPSNGAVPAPATFRRINAFKNRNYGFFAHHQLFLTITDSVFSDNLVGATLSEDHSCTLQNSLIVAFSGNRGNPSTCAAKQATDCLADDCKPGPNAVARSRPSTANIAGVSFGEDTSYSNGDGTLISNLTFVGFQPLCGIQVAAVLVFSAKRNAFVPAHGWQDLTFTPGTLFIWLDPQWTWLGNNSATMRELANFYIFHDKDGAIVSAALEPYTTSPIPGAAATATTPARAFVVANYGPVLPPTVGALAGPSLRNESRQWGSAVCAAVPAWNAFACAGVCYRMLKVYYLEPEWLRGADPKGLPGTALRVRRIEDGATFDFASDGFGPFVDGKYQNIDYATGVWSRFFYPNLLAGPNTTYELTVIGGLQRTQPPTMDISLYDGGGCTDGLQLRIMSSEPGYHWEAARHQNISPANGNPFFSMCTGTDMKPLQVTAATSACNGSTPYLELQLAGVLPPGGEAYVTVARTPKAGTCPSTVSTCGLIAASTVWDYRGDGQEESPPYYQPPQNGSATTSSSTAWTSPALSPNWRSSSAPFSCGFIYPSTTFLPCFSQPAGQRIITYYFRRRFNLVGDPACVRSLLLGYRVQDGLLVYINGQEAVRKGLNTGPVNNTTLAKAQQSFYWANATVAVKGSGSTTAAGSGNYTVPLLQGWNYISAEVHVWQNRTVGAYFDLWLVANTTCGTSTGSVKLQGR